MQQNLASAQSSSPTGRPLSLPPAANCTRTPSCPFLKKPGTRPQAQHDLPTAGQRQEKSLPGATSIRTFYPALLPSGLTFVPYLRALTLHGNDTIALRDGSFTRSHLSAFPPYVRYRSPHALLRSPFLVSFKKVEESTTQRISAFHAAASVSLNLQLDTRVTRPRPRPCPGLSPLCQQSRPQHLPRSTVLRCLEHATIYAVCQGR